MGVSFSILRKVASCILGEQEAMTILSSPCSATAFFIICCPCSEHMYL